MYYPPVEFGDGGAIFITMAYLIIFILTFIAFSLSMVCGGGAGLLLMPVLATYLPAAQVPAALSIGTASSSISRIVMFYKNINWKIVSWFLPAAVPAVFLGAWLLRYINPLYLEIVMGLFLVMNLPMIFRKGESESKTQQPHFVLIIIGFLAGFLSGLTGAVGLLFNRFYLRYNLSKEEIVATRAANEVILHIIKIALYFSFGLLTSQALVIGATIAVAGLLSTWFMKWGIQKITEGLFRKIGYTAMVLSGVLMLTQSTGSLFTENNGNISFYPLSNGIESKIQWQSARFAIEFEYHEGFEFETVIPFSELPTEKQTLAIANKGNADRIIIEEVFAFKKHSYEAYFYKNGKLIRTIDI